MVVLVLRAGIDRLVHLSVQYVLVQVFAGFQDGHDLLVVLRIYGIDLFGHFVGNWNRWGFDFVVVCQDDFRDHQGGLVATVFVKHSQDTALPSSLIFKLEKILAAWLIPWTEGSP